MTKQKIKQRLEYLRGELRAERISTGELVELQSLAKHIDPGDVELLEAAGVPEKPPTKRQLIFATLRRLNWNYGRGELVEGSMILRKGEGSVQYRIPITQSAYSLPTTLQFRVRGNSVLFRGHQRKIEKEE